MYHLTAYFRSNSRAKNYQNRLMYVELIASQSSVVLGHSLENVSIAQPLQQRHSSSMRIHALLEEKVLEKKGRGRKGKWIDRKMLGREEEGKGREGMKRKKEKTGRGWVIVKRKRRKGSERTRMEWDENKVEGKRKKGRGGREEEG